jgi:hypothetical protein
MKRLQLLLVALLCVSAASAQQSFLGKGEKFIKDSLYKNNYVILGRRVIAANTVQLDFGYFDTSKLNDHKKASAEGQDIPNDYTPTATLTCIVESEICTRYIIGYKQADVASILNYLNTKYKKTENDHWEDAKGQFQADTYPLNDLFAVEFKKMDIN